MSWGVVKMINKHVLQLSCLTFFLLPINCTMANEQVKKSVAPKPLSAVDQSGLLSNNKHSATPVNIHHSLMELLTKQRDAKKKKEQKVNDKKASNKTQKAKKKSLERVVHFETPTISRKVSNHGSSFIFEDITRREKNAITTQQALLDKEQRRQKIEALRLSTAAKKQH